ncbi:MAG TPA: hypothetical protein VK864_06425, partial [Longimicrobiales bacterium]|nr:hypothetical protein [Longimicrobiales bacterium]
RAVICQGEGKGVDFMVPAERLCEFHAVVPQRTLPRIPESLQQEWTPEDAARELVRGRMEVLGPVTVRQLADSLELADTTLVDGALLALESEGRILRGQFTASPALSPSPLEWTDRRLLARIHRYTLNRLRAEIEPVSAADFMRFLLHWQHVSKEQQVEGLEGLASVVAQLDGYELPAGAWEIDVLSARCRDYRPDYLDALCLSGRVAWGRLMPMNGSGRVPLRSSPIALMLREHAGQWRVTSDATLESLSSEASEVLQLLRQRGASFFHELVSGTRLLRTQVERALAELAGAGVVTADSFSGLRALLTPSEKRRKAGRRGTPVYGVDTAGRWGLLQTAEADPNDRVEAIARALLKRYGLVFRSLLARESRLPTWRELVMVYRRLEARGEIRGGRFVSGFGGEQFALPEAVGRLRAVRKLEKAGELISISAADPLNLAGIVTPDGRVPAVTRNRVLFRDGIAVAALEAGELKRLADSDLSDDALRSLLARRTGQSPARLYFRSPESRERWLARQRRPAAVEEIKPATAS